MNWAFQKSGSAYVLSMRVQTRRATQTTRRRPAQQTRRSSQTQGRQQTRRSRDSATISRGARQTGSSQRVRNIARGLQSANAPRGSHGSGAGQQTVDYARKFRGMMSKDVKGKMKHFKAAGGTGNNCADFVSSALAATGRGVKHTASVSDLRSQLLKKGWKAIPRSQARPGDVWMTSSNKHGSRHTELVSAKGGTKTIGSNNIRKGVQQISERDKGATGVIYGYRP